jgi:tetratricopeptide (TPR) repeat protein
MNATIKNFVQRFSGILLVCLIFFSIGVSTLNVMLLYTPDSARYLIWAHSLARFEGFKDSSEPEVVRYVVHAPLYSVFLAPGTWFSPQSVPFAKFLTLLTGCIALFLFYRWMEGQIGKHWALLGSIIFACNPLTITYATQILSELPFIVCMLGCCMLLAIPLKEYKWKHKIAVIGIVVAGMMIREIGIVLLIAVVVYCIVKREYSFALLILLSGIAVYGLWYLRNEVWVAGQENPSMRNTQLMVSHLYTTSQASIITEFTARFRTHMAIYSSRLLRIIFFPIQIVYASQLFDALPYLQVVFQRLFRAMLYFFPIISIVPFAAGIWNGWKKRMELLLVGLFSFFYFFLILLYPVDDLRFLFPLMPIYIYFWCIGMRWLYEFCTQKIQQRKIVLISGFVLFGILLLPDMVWAYENYDLSIRYRSSPLQLAEDMRMKQSVPVQFIKPLNIVGRWIVEHAQPGTTVSSKYKELTFWLEGRKIVNLDLTNTPEQCNAMIRDYNIQFVIGNETAAGINEYEGFFARSQRYGFRPVFKAGDVCVFEIEEQPENDLVLIKERGEAVARFSEALRIMEKQPEVSCTILKQLINKYGVYDIFLYHFAIAKSFTGVLDTADTYLRVFQNVQQGISYMFLSKQQRELLANLRMAEISTFAYEKASRFHQVSLSYWENGYYQRARMMMQRSLSADSTFFPSVALSAIYSLHQHDTVGFNIWLQKAEQLESSNPFVEELLLLKKRWERVGNMKNEERTTGRLKTAAFYEKIGLQECAIDELRSVIERDSTRRDAIEMLGRLYEQKHRFAPAFLLYQRLSSLTDDDPAVRIKCSEIRAMVE